MGQFQNGDIVTVVSGAGSPPLAIFEPAPFSPNPIGGQPTHLSTREGFLPQNVNKYMHPEVPTGIPTQPFWHPLPLCNIVWQLLVARCMHLWVRRNSGR